MHRIPKPRTSGFNAAETKFLDAQTRHYVHRWAVRALISQDSTFTIAHDDINIVPFLKFALDKKWISQPKGDANKVTDPFTGQDALEFRMLASGYAIATSRAKK